MAASHGTVEPHTSEREEWMEQPGEGLKAWSRAVLGDVDVSFEPPSAPDPASTRSRVSLYPIALAPLPPTRGKGPAPYQVCLHYLVTVTDADAARAQQLLTQLVFAAMANPDIGLDVAALPAATWSAFGLPPRPGFLILLPLRQERSGPAVPLVEHPVTLRPAALARLDGEVLGPQGLPLMNARVHLLTMGRSTDTDDHGRFAFDGVPAGAQLRLRVEARGWRQEFSASTGSALRLRLP